MEDTILSDIVATISPLTTLSVVLENQATKPEFIRATLVPISPTRLTTGITRIFANTGIIQLDMFRKTGQGTDTTTIKSIISALNAFHPTGYEIMKVYRVANSHAPISQTSGAFISSIRIEYRYFNMF